MTIYSDTLHWSGITPIFEPITDLDLITEFAFYHIASGFHRTFATVAACKLRTLTPPDTWSCPTLGLASVLKLRPISPVSGLWVSNIPRYFCFAFNTCFKQNDGRDVFDLRQWQWFILINVFTYIEEKTVDWRAVAVFNWEKDEIWLSPMLVGCFED